MVEAKLNQIAEELLVYNFDSEKNMSLTNGLPGISLFLFLYAYYKQDERYQEKASKLLLQSVEIVMQGNAQPTFASGLAGLGWLIEFLIQKEYIENEEILSPLDDQLYQIMLRDFKMNNWDFFHGGLGIAFYFLKKHKKGKSLIYLKDAIQALQELREKDTNGIKWKSLNLLNGQQSYDYGLAHGMPSIISFLSKCCQKDVEYTTCKSLMNDAIEHLLSQKKRSQEWPNLYPCYIKNGKTKTFSRLAWCYGDLGICTSLINANKVIGKLDTEINEIIQSLIQRTKLETNKVEDAGFCHGSAGILHLFQYIQKNVSDKISLQQSIDYWQQVCLQFATIEEGIAGFQFYKQGDANEKKLQNVLGILDGVAGVGLSFLSYQNQDFDWDECFLLS